MEQYYKKQKESLLALLGEVKNGNAVRLLKTRRCILDFEPVLNKLHHTAHQNDLVCRREEILDMPCGAPSISSFIRLRWDYYLERLVVERYIYVEDLDKDDTDELAYERQFIITQDFIEDMSERQLHEVYPMCEILIKKVIRSIEDSIKDHKKNHPHLWN